MEARAIAEAERNAEQEARAAAEVRADAEREARTQERENRLAAEARIRELEAENRRLHGGVNDPRPVTRQTAKSLSCAGIPAMRRMRPTPKEALR